MAATGQGKVAVRQSLPLSDSETTAGELFSNGCRRALGYENEFTGLPESSKRHLKTRAGTGAARGDTAFRI